MIDPSTFTMDTTRERTGYHGPRAAGPPMVSTLERIAEADVVRLARQQRRYLQAVARYGPTSATANTARRRMAEYERRVHCSLAILDAWLARDGANGQAAVIWTWLAGRHALDGRTGQHARK